MRIRTEGARAGFTLIEIMIVVAIIGMLMAIAVPNIAKAGKTARRNACIANIKNIESVIEQYKLEQRSAPADLGVLVSAGYFKTEPTCPEGGTYTISPMDGEVTCSVPEHNASGSAAPQPGGQ